MQRSPNRDLFKDDTGAVAATYAMSLTALMVIAGVGFDYGRLAAMDSELQNGADQAALAGATQLDGATGACSRAAARAVDLVTNKTVVATSANTITVSAEAACDATGNVRFWQTKDHTSAATSDANARFIEVIVASRSADYAFTPIAGVLRGTAQAAAMAGLGSSVCKVPPVFMCNPDQGGDPDFTIANYIGKGIRLIENTGGSTYGSGNFGYLANGTGGGTEDLREVLGRTAIPGDCVNADSVTTQTGLRLSALDALNVRMDIYTGNVTQACDNDGSLCPPSANTRKDVMHKGGTNSCAFTNGNGAGWQFPSNAYYPTNSTSVLTGTQITNTAPMGYPRDICHTANQAGTFICDKVGDANWDRNAYFETNANGSNPNYPSSFDISGALGTSTPTRYQVYKYEAANAATRLKTNTSGGLDSIPQPYCRSPGVAVGGATADRRVLSVAVVNCTGANLSGQVTPVKWIDIFLVEPAVLRKVGSTQYTAASEVYVEVIGATTLGGGSTAAQLIRRDVPFLVN